MSVMIEWWRKKTLNRDLENSMDLLPRSTHVFVMPRLFYTRFISFFAGKQSFLCLVGYPRPKNGRFFPIFLKIPSFIKNTVPKLDPIRLSGIQQTVHLDRVFYKKNKLQGVR